VKSKCIDCSTVMHACLDMNGIMNYFNSPIMFCKFCNSNWFNAGSENSIMKFPMKLILKQYCFFLSPHVDFSLSLSLWIAVYTSTLHLKAIWNRIPVIPCFVSQSGYEFALNYNLRNKTIKFYDHVLADFIISVTKMIQSLLNYVSTFI